MADHEHVELEQVPLKSDMDAPATDESKEGEKVGKKEAGVKKWPFFSKTKKKDFPDDDGKTETVVTEMTTIVSKPKTAAFKNWFAKKTKEQMNGEDKEDAAKNMTIGINMLDRDERSINEHVKLSFEDIYGEPDTSHSWDCVWRITYRIFTWTRCFVYRLLALFLAIPSAIIFGLIFAILTVVNIFACVPIGRALTIPATWIAKTWNFLVRSLFDPCFRSCGLCLSGIAIRRYGMNSDPTADLNIV